MIVYRFAEWYPNLVTHVFSVCTPYMARRDKYMSTEDMVNGPLPQFGYQLQLASGVVEENVVSKEDIYKFINIAYGGKPSTGRPGFTPQKGLDLDAFKGEVGKSPLLNEEVE